jgi:hypothetical protein
VSRSAASLWPREHGAYAQLGVALVAALILAPNLRSLGQGLLTVALFLASEPLLQLLGGRREPAPRAAAWRRLALLAGWAALGGTAWLGVPAQRMLALLPAAALGAALFGLFRAGRERTAAGEILAAWGFAAAVLPMGVIAGAGVRRAIHLALILAAVATLGTVLVHGHLRATRRPGARWFAVLLGTGLCAGAWVLAGRGLLQAGAWLAFMPMTLAAVGIAAVPPAPWRLRRVGWAAAACALAGGVLAAIT